MDTRGFLLVVALGSSGCRPAVTFDVPLTAETEVTGNGFLEQIVDAFGFGDLANIDFSTTEAFENNDVRREQVTAAEVTALSISIVEPATADFDWLEEIAFSVETDDEPKVYVGGGSVGDHDVSAVLDVEDAELAPYVQASSCSITADVNARLPPQDTTVRVDVVFSVTATVF